MEFSMGGIFPVEFSRWNFPGGTFLGGIYRSRKKYFVSGYGTTMVQKLNRCWTPKNNIFVSDCSNTMVHVTLKKHKWLVYENVFQISSKSHNKRKI